MSHPTFVQPPLQPVDGLAFGEALHVVQDDEELNGLHIVVNTILRRIFLSRIGSAYSI